MIGQTNDGYRVKMIGQTIDGYRVGMIGQTIEFDGYRVGMIGQTIEFDGYRVGMIGLSLSGSFTSAVEGAGGPWPPGASLGGGARPACRA